MKITSQNLGQTGPSPDRIANASGTATSGTATGGTATGGTADDRNMDPQVRRIKMRVNQSPDRMIPDQSPLDQSPEQPSLDQSPEQPSLEQSPDELSAISDTVESVDEVTQPLSPQFAALAKGRRALQVKERELLEREKASTAREYELVRQLKEQPLRTLQEQGILTENFYNQLTDFLVSGQTNPELAALKAEIKALKEGVDKNFIDRDQAQETQALAEMKREAESLARDGDQFEMIRETRSIPTVMDLIHRTYKQTGEVMDVVEAMQLVEDQLLADNLRIASLKKIQAKVQPVQLQPQQPGMKTLTNRDTASVPMDRRSRAMLAALGQLKG